VCKSQTKAVKLITGANTSSPVVSTTTLAVGRAPLAVAVVPDQAPVAVLHYGGGVLGKKTTLNATASTVAFGTIVSYTWNFGDGTTATTTGATTNHLYPAAGKYTATVTETDSAGTSTTVAFTGQTVSRNGGPSATASVTVKIS
jgi:PKD repeat protein